MKRYVNFLNLASDMLVPFDHTAEMLLEEVAIRHNEGKTVTVSDAMEMAHIASAATMHRKMNDLMMFGYIELEQVPPDRRTKYLKLTHTAVRYFERKEEAMEESMK